MKKRSASYSRKPRSCASTARPRAAELPPYAHLALLRAEAKDAIAPQEFLNACAEAAGSADGVALLGPLPAPMPLRAGMTRSQLLFSATERARLQAALPGWMELWRQLPAARRVRWSLDVDPVDLY